MGVKEKKQIAAFEEQLNGKLAPELRNVWDNPNLAFNTEIEEGIEADGIRIATYGIVEEFFPAVMEASKDADYLEELRKITAINFHIKTEVPKNMDHYIYCDMKLNGTTLDVTLDTTHSPGNGSWTTLQKYLESLF